MNRQGAKVAKEDMRLRPFMHEPDQELDQIAHEVIGAAIEVHRELGPGYLESTYVKALAIELTRRKIRFVQEAPIQLSYKGELIGEGRIDLLIEDRLIVELKAIEKLATIHHAQVMSYLKITRITLGLLINFNVVVLRDGIKRIILT